jgi:hypothetical protein
MKLVLSNLIVVAQLPLFLFFLILWLHSWHTIQTKKVKIEIKILFHKATCNTPSTTMATVRGQEALLLWYAGFALFVSSMH